MKSRSNQDERIRNKASKNGFPSSTYGRRFDSDFGLLILLQLRTADTCGVTRSKEMQGHPQTIPNEIPFLMYQRPQPWLGVVLSKKKMTSILPEGK